MQRVERHIAIGNKRLDELCFLSKNLYNYVNYLIRQEFTQNKKFLSEYEVTTMLAKDKQADYIALPSQTSQQIIKILFKNWKGFFKLCKVKDKLINADLNGAIGILRKVVGERLWQIADRGVVGTPSRIQFL